MSTWIANETQIFKCRLYFFNLNLSSLSAIHIANMYMKRIEAIEVLIFETFVR
jgi:hypothetical protein